MTHANQLAGRKEWLALVALAVPPLLVAMDITVLYFAVPSIAASLAPSSTQQLWMIDIYGFVLAGMLLTMGNIGDIIGRRQTLMIGCAIFGGASAIAAWSRNPEMLITLRAIQGLGGAALMPSALALLRNVFQDAKQRRTAITVWSLAVSAGAGLGPVLSGILLNNFWWGSIFLINAPIVVILLIAMPFLIKNYKTPPEQVGRFDILSSVLSLVAVLSVIWGVKEAVINGISALSIGAMVGGLVVAGLFLLRQRSLAQPMIDATLFRRRGFLSVLLLNTTGFFCVIGFGVFTTQYLQEVLGMRPLTAALWTMASPLLAGGVVPVAMGMVEKVRAGYLIAGGFVLAVIGFAIMTQVHVHSSVFVVVAGAVGVGVGTALMFALITDMVIAVAPVEQTGSVSALAKTFQEFGGALGLAIFGVIGTSIYRDQLGTSVPGVPNSAVEAGRQTIGAATGAASHLAGGAKEALLAAARAAFTHGLDVTAVLGIVVAAASALMAAFRLNHITHTDTQEAVEAAETAGQPVSATL